MIPPRLASRPVQSSTVGQTIDPVVTSTQLPAASSYSNPFGNIAYSSTSAYDDLLAKATEKYGALMGLGKPYGGASYGSGADNDLPSGLFPKIPSGD